MISRRRTALFGHVAWLDVSILAHCALVFAMTRPSQWHLPAAWKRLAGRPRGSWVQQIGDGSSSKIGRQWNPIHSDVDSPFVEDWRNGPPLSKRHDDDDETYRKQAIEITGVLYKKNWEIRTKRSCYHRFNLVPLNCHSFTAVKFRWLVD